MWTLIFSWQNLFSSERKISQKGRGRKVGLSRVRRRNGFFCIYWHQYQRLTTEFSLFARHRKLVAKFSRYMDIFPLCLYKKCFLRFFGEKSGLPYVLLHESNINVAIALILVYSKSLYDIQGPSYVFPLNA